MEAFPDALGIFISIALGSIVGLEREFGKRTEKRKYIIGVRTSMLLCLLGYLSVFFGEYVDLVFSMSIGVVCALVGLSLAYISRLKVYKSTGITTFVGGILLFFVGVLVGFSEYLFALILTILITAILMMRNELHFFAEHLTRTEILSAVKFAIIAFVVFPILPNSTLDPWGVFNPYFFWYIVVLISSIQFLSFILLRVFKKKGVYLSSFFGGFINSEATTCNIIGFEKKSKDASTAVSNIILTNIAMIISCIVVAMVISPSLEFFAKFISLLLLPLFLMIISFVLNVKPNTKASTKKIETPFSIVSALKFSVIFFVVRIFAEGIQYYSSGFLGLASFVGGIFASTPVIASLAMMLSEGSITMLQAIKFMGFSIAGTILNKNFWSRISGNKKLTKKLLLHTLIHSASLLAMILLFV